MSAGPLSWEQVALENVPPLALLVSLVAFPIALLVVPRLRPRASALVGAALTLWPMGTLAWGKWVTDLRGFEPIEWAGVAAGCALGWWLAILVRRALRPRPARAPL